MSINSFEKSVMLKQISQFCPKLVLVWYVILKMVVEAFLEGEFFEVVERGEKRVALWEHGRVCFCFSLEP